MRDAGDHLIERWTLDYGDGSQTEDVLVPHAWRQDLPLTVDGPVVYTTSLEVPKTRCKLQFRGVSYAAEVAIENTVVHKHRGIWSAFEVPLDAYLGTRIEVKVSVTKNGGATYPLREVASGYLPYLFHTFGGIYGEVCLVDDAKDPIAEAVPSRCRIVGSEIFVDDIPFYPRGLLHLGWYPDLGHTNPGSEQVRKEVKAVKALGFNFIKFGHWAPPHRYLEFMREEGLEACLELPIWNPSPEPEHFAQILSEVDEILRQYRCHDNILFWSLGAELSSDLQGALTRLVRNLTGAPIIGAGTAPDLVEFEAECEPMFYPLVLESMIPAASRNRPTILGSAIDVDVHRDLACLANEIPFWGSNLSELNERGVRRNYNLPDVLVSNRFAEHPLREGHKRVMESTRQKALFVRKTGHEALRARGWVAGYIASGWRDTPTSSSGIFDDWDLPRFSPGECLPWNGTSCLFLFEVTQAQWVAGGFRPGFADTCNVEVGQIHWRVGIHSDVSERGGLVWRVLSAGGNVVAWGADRFLSTEALHPTEVGAIRWDCEEAGEYRLEVEFGTAKNSWPIFVTAPFSDRDRDVWTTDDPTGILGFESQYGDLSLSTRTPGALKPGIVVLTGEGTVAKPFWRHSAYEFLNNEFWSKAMFADQWSRLLPISPDRVIDPAWLLSLDTPYEVLMRRIDVQTYEEHPVLVRAGATFLTTLRPFGGLGAQPSGVANNPAGAAFLRALGQAI